MANALLISFTIFAVMGVHSFLTRNEIEENRKKRKQVLSELLDEPESVTQD